MDDNKQTNDNDIIDNIPADTAEEIPTDIPADSAAEISADLPADTAEEIPTDIPADSAEDITPDLPSDTAEDSVTGSEGGFYNVKISEDEIDPEEAANNRSTKISAVIVASFAVLGVIAIVIVLVTVIKANSSKEQSDTNYTVSGEETDISPLPAGENASAETESDVSGTDAETREPIDYTDYGVKVTLGDYKNLSLDVAEVSVTEEEILDAQTRYIEDLGLVELHEITDRPAMLGDIVTIDFDGIVDGEHSPGTTGTDFELTLGSNQTIDGFESGILGLEIGDSKVLNLAFPDPYPNSPDLAGKPVDFTITLKKIRYRYYPDLTDEIISANSSYKTVDEYRAASKDELLAAKESEARERAFETTIDSLVASCTFSPEVENEIADRMEYYRKYYDNYFIQNLGMDALSYSGMTKEQYDKMLRDISDPEVKYPYIYQEIARSEGYYPSDSEKTEKFNEIFYDVYGFESEEDIYKTFTKTMCDVTVEHELLSSFGYKWLRGSLGFTD
ncbi:MAG: FKBP-type peptidyl-prolyl cis-trans isomerase [Lachnospiraceae bacterium]|nr:FKBP-type peptidyl-prolyl cis-trans isomerase [Lachnospiraceae bacterium]